MYYCSICSHFLIRPSAIKPARAPSAVLTRAMTATGYTCLSKPVRVYICSGTFSIYVEFQPDDVVVDEEKTKHAFACQLPCVSWDTLAPTCSIAPGEEHGVFHRDELLHCGGSFASAVNRAITLATCTCPARAPHAIVFLGGYHAVNAQQIIAQWRASFDDKYMPPMPGAMVTPVETPLECWYSARKEFKAAEAALLKKLNEALVEKAADPALHDGTLDFEAVTAHQLERLAERTSNLVVNTHPVRVAAYESVGIVYGPVQLHPTHDGVFAPLSTRGNYQVREMRLPWCSDVQK